MVLRWDSTWSKIAPSMAGHSDDEPTRVSGVGCSSGPAMAARSERSVFQAARIGALPGLVLGPAGAGGTAVMSRTGTTTRRSRAGGSS